MARSSRINKIHFLLHPHAQALYRKHESSLPSSLPTFILISTTTASPNWGKKILKPPVFFLCFFFFLFFLLISFLSFFRLFFACWNSLRRQSGGWEGQAVVFFFFEWEREEEIRGDFRRHRAHRWKLQPASHERRQKRLVRSTEEMAKRQKASSNRTPHAQ